MPRWANVDSNPATKAIASGGGRLYQLHDSGRIFRFTGVPNTGWEQLDANPATSSITAAGDHLYQLHDSGSIWRFTGKPGGWQMLDANPATRLITAAGDHLYQLHDSGSIWRFTGTPRTWERLDANPNTIDIAAAHVSATAGSSGQFTIPPTPAENHLYQRHNSGSIWRFTGKPGGWQLLDANRATKAIAAFTSHLWQLHGSGQVWEYAGNPGTGWHLVQDEGPDVAMIIGGGQRVKGSFLSGICVLRTNGTIQVGTELFH